MASPAKQIIPSSLYRAVWRWHFYAGLLTLPILVVLAVTGALYLFKDEIHHVVYRDMMDVPKREAAFAAPSAIQQSAESALDGQMLQITLPERPDRSAQALVRVGTGDVRNAYLNPYDGHFLGSTPYGGLMQTVRNIHSLLIIAPWANSLVEIAAGWAIIMVLTGIFLWWPRGADGGVLTIRGRPRQRVFWRDFHAVVGICAGAVILFLAVTGMPWSKFWGDKVQGWATASGLGTPAAPAAVTPYFLLGVTKSEGGRHNEGGHEHIPQKPWALEDAAQPHSHDETGASIGIDAAIARFEALGLRRPFGVQPPEGPKGAYAATYLPARVEDVRLVYLDQHTGEVLGDVGFAQYGPAAKAIEWGIAVHQGLQYGEFNRYLMLFGCLSVIALAASSVVMWWKRRPQGSFGAPPHPKERRAIIVVGAAIAIVGAIYPLTGISFVVALMIDGTYALLGGGNTK